MVATEDGLIGVKKVMTVNLTADHRLVYGAQAAEFLQVSATPALHRRAPGALRAGDRPLGGESRVVSGLVASLGGVLLATRRRSSR